MSFLKKAKEVLSMVGKKNESAEKNISEKVDEKQALQERINQNRISGGVIKLRLEELRAKILLLNKNDILNTEKIDKVDCLLKNVQDKLESPVDVLQDVHSLDEAAIELIQVMTNYVEKSGAHMLLSSLTTLCECLVNARSSGDVRTIEYGMLKMRYIVLDLQKEATERHRDNLQKSCAEVLTHVQQFVNENRDTMDLNAVYMSECTQLLNAKQEIDVYIGLMIRIKSEMDRLETLPADMPIQEVTAIISGIENDMREQLKTKAEQIASYREQSARNMVQSKLALEKVQSILPGVSMEAEEESRRLFSAELLAQAEAQAQTKERVETQAEKDAQQNQLTI